MTPKEIWLKTVKELYPYFDFSKSVYINAHTKVLVNCLKHNYEFYTNPDNLKRGKQKGCKYCGLESRIKTITYKKEDFIKNTPHKEFDYSNIEFVNMSSEIKNIRCVKHNIFFNIKNGEIFNELKIPCPVCLKENGHTGTAKSNEEYISQLKEKDLDKLFDLSKINYINARTKIILICRKCGKEFKHEPRGFLYGVSKACPNCNYYIGEETIKSILTENNINFTQQYKFKDCKDEKILSFDFYLPDNNIVIEYQGVQHYRPLKHWGGEERFKKQLERDKIKRDYCKSNKIKEIEIKYDENIFTKLKENGII